MYSYHIYDKKFLHIANIFAFSLKKGKSFLSKNYSNSSHRRCLIHQRSSTSWTIWQVVGLMILWIGQGFGRHCASSNVQLADHPFEEHIVGLKGCRGCRMRGKLEKILMGDQGANQMWIQTTIWWAKQRAKIALDKKNIRPRRPLFRIPAVWRMLGAKRHYCSPWL